MGPSLAPWVGRQEVADGEIHESEERLGDQHCRVTLDLEYEPEGMVENVGDFLGVVQRRATGDLKRFKTFIEHRSHETGAWRGSIPHSGSAR